MSLRGVVALPLAAALLAAPVSARAQGAVSQEPRAAAQALFEEAMALRKKGEWPEVCAKLDESQRLDPAPGTKFYLAECLEQTGKLASAWLLYTEVADGMANTGQEKREAAARERAAALAKKVARLQVTVPGAARVPGLAVRRDGVLIGEAQWGFAAPVDLGTHTIEASAPGRPTFKKTVELREAGGTVTVELPPWTTPAPPGADSGAAPPAPTAEVRSPSPFPLRTAGIVLGGLGIASAAVGAALGSVALSRQAESNRGPCDPVRDVCSPEGLALRAEAMTAAAGSTVTFIAGGVLFAAGVVLVLWPAGTTKSKGPVATALKLYPDRLSLEGRW